MNRKAPLSLFYLLAIKRFNRPGKLKDHLKQVLIIVLLFMARNSHAQQKANDTTVYDKHFVYLGTSYIDLRHATPAQLQELAKRKMLRAITKDRFLFSEGEMIYGGYQTLATRFQQKTGATIYEGIAWNWGNRNALRKYIINGNSAVEFANTKITKQNAKNYRYHIVSNDEKEIVGWTTPNQFKTSADGNANYAYLGNFPAQTNGYLKIEIYNVNDYKDRDGIIVDWRPLKAPWARIGVEYETIRNFGNSLYVPLNKKPAKRSTNNFVNKINEVILADSLVRIVVDLQYSRNYFLKSELVRTINGKTEKLQLEDSQGRLTLYKEYWKEPGDYELIFYPVLRQPGGTPITYFQDKSLHYKFTVLPPLNAKKLYSSKQIALIVVVLCAIFGLIMRFSITYIRKKGKQKLTEEQQQKEISRSQLQSIRSQLNPHFMFNALAGIQNLMNKNKVDEASRYLTQFARLTRNVLDNKELVSLTEEKDLLTDYLQMEQLRFGFTYQVNIADDLDPDNVEIPSMLLQPFVENAVKHGIAEKETNGKIAVSIQKQNQNLIIKITDNGNGFDTSKNYEGYGLQLSKNRISLLNTIYKETPFLLDMKSTHQLTEITITLAQWL